jgi:hypothetical protein
VSRSAAAALPRGIEPLPGTGAFDAHENRLKASRDQQAMVDERQTLVEERDAMVEERDAIHLEQQFPAP